MDENTLSSEKERRKHWHMICALADEFGITEVAALTLYENELRALESHARIKIFLPLLTMRHIKEMLKRNDTGH